MTWRKTATLDKQRRNQICRIDKDCEEANTAQCENIQQTTRFYSNLYKSTTNVASIARTNNDPSPEELSISEEEIKAAIKSLKNGKSPGPDTIANEMLKNAANTLSLPLSSLFTKCMEQRKIPESWNTALIILIYKKGDPMNLKNYRPISLLSNLYKLFTKILTNRITEQLEKHQGKDQAGFRPGRSTVGHIYTLNQIIEKCNEYNTPLYMTFIDFEKAFDSVETTAILNALKEQGEDDAYINMLEHIYSYGVSRIQLHPEGQPFHLERGVCQNCLLVVCSRSSASLIGKKRSTVCALVKHI